MNSTDNSVTRQGRIIIYKNATDKVKARVCLRRRGKRGGGKAWKRRADSTQTHHHVRRQKSSARGDRLGRHITRIIPLKWQSNRKSAAEKRKKNAAGRERESGNEVKEECAQVRRKRGTEGKASGPSGAQKKKKKREPKAGDNSGPTRAGRRNAAERIHRAHGSALVVRKAVLRRVAAVAVLLLVGWGGGGADRRRR